MKNCSIKENQNIEKRIAITPEIIKKYSSLGFEICLSKNYGSHLGSQTMSIQIKELNFQMMIKKS